LTNLLANKRQNFANWQKQDKKGKSFLPIGKTRQKDKDKKTRQSFWRFLRWI
jgi:hypothetical protein